MSSPVVRTAGTAQSPIVVDLRSCFCDPLLDVMNILNEVTLEYSDAISFAPGRPPDRFFHVDEDLMALPAFVANLAERRSRPIEQAWRDAGQYTWTNGVITEELTVHLARDEGIIVAPDAIMVTVGAQEAMAITLMGLFEPSRDILLVSDPAYIGITGLARLLGIRIVPIEDTDRGLTAEAVETAIAAAARVGRARALYATPDFSNPLGSTLDIRERHALIDVCCRAGVLIIEDNAYGAFAYDSPRLPTLKALDRDRTVVYIGSFSKTLFPSLRIGYLVADQPVASATGPLARALSRVKSLTTVNTPTLPQLIVAGALARGNGSLEAVVAPMRHHLKLNRDRLIAALESEFGVDGAVAWNRPAGGFFITVTLPFSFGVEQMRQAAADYGVIVCPMRLFCLDDRRLNQIRLAFSSIEPEAIAVGIGRLARFIRVRNMENRIRASDVMPDGNV